MDRLDSASATEQPQNAPRPGARAMERPRFQFRLRTLLIVMTVLCIFLAVPAVAWVLGFLTAYVALSIIAVGALICVQLPIFFLFQELGWLPPRHPSRQEANDGPRGETR